ncbi:MAG: hypothetical protein AB8I40_12090 [Anaerolineales bacterium]|jgi:hypothetical protein
MNIYYTAKDIEELVARGIYVLELGPHTSLTDFARETAEQLDVTLIDVKEEPGKQAPQAPQAAPASAPRAPEVSFSETYNKPRGCQAGSRPAASIPAALPLEAASDQRGSTPVNRLVDLMGKIINRGD